jgi:hypothetical protein
MEKVFFKPGSFQNPRVLRSYKDSDSSE